ncbi:MAG: hypothetical protein NC124_02190 [Clostridium sp.]|nr:hypothetical protein [Clostridium sp.]
MNDYYKVYVGRFEKGKRGLCSAPALYRSVFHKDLGSCLDALLKIVKTGLDIYIKKPTGEVYAYHRDLMNMPKEDAIKCLEPNDFPE